MGYARRVTIAVTLTTAAVMFKRRPKPEPIDMTVYDGFPWWETRQHEYIEHLHDNPAHDSLTRLIAQDFATHLKLTPNETELFLALSTEWNGTWAELHNAVKKL